MRVAIIGAGGAGLAAAYLLEERHDVTLFEREARLGGHVQSVAVRAGEHELAVSAGVHFFSRRMYPRFFAFLEHLGLPVHEYEPTCTFYDKHEGIHICMPPTGNLTRLKTVLAPEALVWMLRMARTLQLSESVVLRGDWALTLGEFVARIGHPSSYAEQFLFPFFAASWGVSSREIREFSARAVLSYTTLHRPAAFQAGRWGEVEGGIERYPQTLRAACTRTTFHVQHPVTAITREAGAYVIEMEGQRFPGFDRVLVATNAKTARGLVRDLVGAESLRTALDGFEYADTRIAIHRDPSVMPADRRLWSIVNLSRSGGYCALHHYAGVRAGVDVFRSWITHARHEPRDIIADFTYQHAKPTPAYFAAQSSLAARNGKQGLWFAGVYSHGFDSHESTLESAIRAAAGMLCSPAGPSASTSAGERLGRLTREASLRAAPPL